MKVLVAVKHVLDYAARVRVKPDLSGVDLKGAKLSINPFCEIGLEAAIRLKEAGHVSEVVAVSVGDKTQEAALRHSFSLGADRAIHVATASAESSEPLMVAQVLSALAEREQAQMLLLGKQAIDDDNNQTGQMCAALLGWPQGTFLSLLELQDEGKRLKVMREVDEGQQEISLSLPAVLTTDLRLNTPRYAPLKAVIMSKKKPLERLSMSELGVDYTPQLKTLKVEEPPQRQKCVMVKDVQSLVEFLNEKRIL